MNQSASDLNSLLTVVAATLDDSGSLIEANAGFRRLVDAAMLPAGNQVGSFFIQPDFASLVSSAAGAQGEVHRGLITVGALMGTRRSLRGRVWREGLHLRILAEYDVEGLEQLIDTVLEVNSAYVDAQAELAQKNLKMQQLTTLLTQQKAELEVTLARIKRLEGLILICMSCKKIRSENDDWHQLERYISEHTEATFSHGICPICFAREMAKLD